MPLPPHLFDDMVHKALSSETRRKILLALEKKPKYLSELADEIGKKPQTIDFHMTVLQEIGLIEGNWSSGKKYYELGDKKILDFLREGKAVPPEYRPKPPHEITEEAWEDVKTRLDRIEKKLDKILKS